MLAITADGIKQFQIVEKRLFEKRRKGFILLFYRLAGGGNGGRFLATAISKANGGGRMTYVRVVPEGMRKSMKAKRLHSNSSYGF